MIFNQSSEASATVELAAQRTIVPEAGAGEGNLTVPARLNAIFCSSVSKWEVLVMGGDVDGPSGQVEESPAGRYARVSSRYAWRKRRRSAGTGRGPSSRRPYALSSNHEFPSF